jgi:hypothetical protein
MDRRSVWQKRLFSIPTGIGTGSFIYTDDRSVYEHTTHGYKFVCAWAWDEQSRKVVEKRGSNDPWIEASQRVQEAYASVIAGSIVSD